MHWYTHTLQFWRTQVKIVIQTPLIESVIQILWKCSLKALLTWYCYQGIHLIHRSELLCHLVMLSDGQRNLKNVSGEDWEALSNLHKAVYLLALLILNLKLKDYPLTANHIFSQKWYILLASFWQLGSYSSLSCEGKRKVLATLQGGTEEELTFDTQNLPVRCLELSSINILKIAAPDTPFEF